MDDAGVPHSLGDHLHRIKDVWHQLSVPKAFAYCVVARMHRSAGHDKIADSGKAYSDPVFAVAIESESEYSATLLSLWQEYFAKLIKCDPAEFDSLYAQYSQEFLDAGYQEIMDERLAAYEAGNTTKLPAIP